MNVLNIIFKVFGVEDSNLGQEYVLLALVAASSFLMPLLVVALFVLLDTLDGIVLLISFIVFTTYLVVISIVTFGKATNYSIQGLDYISSLLDDFKHHIDK